LECSPNGRARPKPPAPAGILALVLGRNNLSKRRQGSIQRLTRIPALVAQMVKGVEGDEITLKYKDGEKKIVVVPNTAIVTYVPADKSELKPGAKIFIAAAQSNPIRCCR
jgi:antitoxin component of MazEF toxin-antitoxin module